MTAPLDGGHGSPVTNATFANPTILVKLIEWADKILTE